MDNNVNIPVIRSPCRLIPHGTPSFEFRCLYRLHLGRLGLAAAQGPCICKSYAFLSV